MGLDHSIRCVFPEVNASKAAELSQVFQANRVWVIETGVAGGETGIRTLETVSRLHAFQACAFDHSATSPAGRV